MYSLIWYIVYNHSFNKILSERFEFVKFTVTLHFPVLLLTF